MQDDPMPHDVARHSQEPLRASAPSFHCLLLPGWRGSGPDHWQRRWQSLHHCELVEQSDWEWPRRGDWMARLDDAVQRVPGDKRVLLIAHSLGCHLAVAWAAHSQHTARVQVALLVAPPDLERDDMPPQVCTWRPIVRVRLPFNALVVMSNNDPYAASARSAAMAADWGSASLTLGDHGHINGDSGLGDWPQGWALVEGLLRPQRGPQDDHRQSPAW